MGHGRPAGDAPWRACRRIGKGLGNRGEDRLLALSDTTAQNYELRDPDVRLMLQVRDGNAAAFEELVLRYQGRLTTVLEQLVRQRDLAEDLAQEVFLRVFVRAKPMCRGRNSRRGCSPLPTTWPATRCDRWRGGGK